MTGYEVRGRIRRGVLALVLATTAVPAVAWETYHDPNQNGSGYCADCHSGFVGRGPLHNLHQGSNSFTNTCNLCHTGSGRNNPYTMWSVDSTDPYGCVGCHGRDYGETTTRSYDNGSGSINPGGAPKMSGYGLRKYHLSKGVMECLSCHPDVSQSFIQGENVNPPYYARSDVNITDSCNTDGSEDGTPEPSGEDALGLDNDGDTLVDGADPDCGAAICGNGVLETGEQCDDGNTVGGDCCSATCQFEAGGSTCDDGVGCTVSDVCDGAGGCAGSPSDAACDDGMFCNGAETCDAALDCQPGTPVDCNDGVGCTLDSCDEINDVCLNAPDDAACDDGMFCNGAETCDAALDCQPGTPVDCNDGVGCTLDSCDEINDVCLNAPDDAACDDGMFCNGAETCDAVLDCQAGAAVDCDDADICTDDSCNETNDRCDNIFDVTNDPSCATSVCGDGSVQMGEDCDDGNVLDGDCCSSTCTFEAIGSPCDDGIGCTLADSCDGAGACAGTASDAACDDGMFCNGAETCDAILDCQAGTPVDCNDGVGCTADSCDEVNDVCVNAPDDAVCDDGMFCNGAETCDPTQDCQAGTPVSCNDGVGCTADSCDEVNDVCINAPDDAVCDDGMFCNGAETCDPIQDCQAGANVDCDDADLCTDDSCNEATDQCDNVFDATNDPSCQALLCGNGVIDTGEECDDGNVADGDCCSSTCAFEIAGSPCDDALFCTESDVCDGAGGCAGAPRDCGDGVGCTVDSCDETNDLCVNAPNDPACDDGEFCNGVESCHPLLDCEAGVPVDCDDADVCTDDSCNETSDVCENVFDVTNDPSCQLQCPDGDGDGVSAVGGNCGPVDCDDTDPGVFPGNSEDCNDDKDNDCDGLIDAADESCVTAGWRPRPGPLDDPAYVGSATCAECHESRAADWLGTLHARVQIRPGDAQAAGFPVPANDPAGGVELQSWTDVLFVVGQKWRTHYVDRQGFVQGRRWNFLLGDWEPAQGGQRVPYDCGPCHTTGYDENATFEDGNGVAVPGIVGSWTEYGVGCEACHGPGAEHAADPERDNINRITFDWYDPDADGVPDPVALRSSLVCANCHSGPDRQSPVTTGGNHEQYNDWLSSPHGSSVEFTTINTYCAQCHSPGNADWFAREHSFTYFDPKSATHVACVSCHDPHRTSQARWETLAWPPGGRQDPRGFPPRIARYRGTDDDPATRDHQEFDESNALCLDCHRAPVGFRRHRDARPPEIVVLHPPFSVADPDFEVPHGEHIEQGYAECVDCHMPYSRQSASLRDIRSHAFEPNANPVPHFSETCGQCHSEAPDCVWCHTDFARGTGDPTGEERRPRERIPSRRSRPQRGR